MSGVAGREREEDDAASDNTTSGIEARESRRKADVTRRPKPLMRREVGLGEADLAPFGVSGDAGRAGAGELDREEGIAASNLGCSEAAAKVTPKSGAGDDYGNEKVVEEIPVHK